MKLMKLVLLAVLLVSPAFAGSLESVQPTPLLVATADSNDSALDVNQTSWAATADWPEISAMANIKKVKWYVYDPCGPNDTTFSYQIYIADYGCNAELVATGTATCGAAQLSHNPASLAELNSGDPNSLYCWVDTLGTPTEDWAKSVNTGNDGGANSTAAVLFDRLCGKRIWCRIYSRSSGTMVVYCVAWYY